MPETRAQALRQILKALPARQAQPLTFFAVEGRSVGQCADLFGISEPAFDIMLLRAAEAYQSALEHVAQRPGGRRSPWRTAEETSRARALREALDGHAVPADPALLSLRDALRELQQQAPALRALDEEALRRAQQTPRRWDEVWLRRLLVIAVLALTALLQARELLSKRPPRYEPRPPEPPKTGR